MRKKFQNFIHTITIIFQLIESKLFETGTWRKKAAISVTKWKNSHLNEVNEVIDGFYKLQKPKRSDFEKLFARNRLQDINCN